MRTAMMTPCISCSRSARYAGRQIVLLLLLAVCLPSPSWAGQLISVAQMEQWLAGAHGQSDGKLAKQLDAMTLTERISPTLLQRWQVNLPGSKSREALTALADVSALLNPPAADMLPADPPDLQAQGAILSKAIDYVVQTLAKLPDFYATRATAHFEDSPSRQAIDNISVGNSPIRGISIGAPVGVPHVSYQSFGYVPLHRTGQSSASVSYRDGVEMVGSQKMDRAMIGQPAAGLTTAGEFGPILSVVLNDAMHSTINWGYWEQGPHGRLAVFRYVVPDDRSSYAVALKHGTRSEKLFPAYRGVIAIDPASGAILRITVVANPAQSHNVVQSAIVVEYGVVSLGGTDYICPVKGVALLKTAVDDPQSASMYHVQLNDVTFTGYHMLRGDVRILPEQP